MKLKYLIFGGAVVLIVGIGVLVRQYVYASWDIQNLPMPNETVVAFGDSLVFGVGSTKENDFVSQLGTRLGADILNLGVPGDTTKDGLDRIDEVLALNPGMVIVLLGGNDALRKIPREDTRKNISEIVVRLQEVGSVVVLVGVRGGLFGDPFDEMYEELARFYGAVLVPDILDGILLNPELTADQIHPNDAGYTIVSDRIYKKVKSYMQR